MESIAITNEVIELMEEMNYSTVEGDFIVFVGEENTVRTYGQLEKIALSSDSEISIKENMLEFCSENARLK